MYDAVVPGNGLVLAEFRLDLRTYSSNTLSFQSR